MDITSYKRDLDSFKRYNSASRRELCIYWIDKTKQEAIFEDKNGHYRATLNSCSCKDFQKRYEPCEHVYRLAMELKIIPSSDYNNTTENTFPTKSSETIKTIKTTKDNVCNSEIDNVKSKEKFLKTFSIINIFIWVLRAIILYYWYYLFFEKMDDTSFTQLATTIFFTYWVFVGYKE